MDYQSDCDCQECKDFYDQMNFYLGEIHRLIVVKRRSYGSAYKLKIVLKDVIDSIINDLVESANELDLQIVASWLYSGSLLYGHFFLLYFMDKFTCHFPEKRHDFVMFYNEFVNGQPMI